MITRTKWVSPQNVTLTVDVYDAGETHGLECCAIKEFAGIQDSEIGDIGDVNARALEIMGQIAVDRFEDGMNWGALVLTELLNEHPDRIGEFELHKDKQVMPVVRKLVHKAGFGEFVVCPTVYNPNEGHWVKMYIWTTTKEQTNRFSSWNCGNDTDIAGDGNWRRW